MKRLMLLTTVALARPLRSNVEHDVHSEGVDIALVVDRSGSMQFEDLEEGKSRLAVVKEVIGEFAARRMSDRENAADNVALITFARYPRLLCPFTLDVDALHGFLEQVQLVERANGDLDGSLARLRQEAIDAEAQAQEYKNRFNLTSIEGTTMAEAEVSNLNRQIAEARADRAELVEL